MHRVRQKLVFGCILLSVLLGQPGYALKTGHLFVRVTNPAGAGLPTATLTLIGPGAARVGSSALDGRCPFFGLDPGVYHLTAELDGFSSAVYPQIKIYVGRSIQIEITLDAAVAEILTIYAPSPVSDMRIVQSSSNADRTELEEIPRQLDHSSVIAQTPGVLVETSGGDGRLPAFVAPGSNALDNVVTLDGGAPLASLTIAGPAPDFSDPGALEEVQTATGGSDVTTSTAGVQLNLITRRGTDEWLGSGRYLKTPGARGELSGSGPGDPTPNGVDQTEEYGLEGGGRLLRDRLWAWGALGRRRLDLLAAGGQPDTTAIDSRSYKLNAQLGAQDSAVLSVTQGDNHKTGLGANPFRSREAAWDQRAGQQLWSFEESHLFSSWAYLSGSLSGADDDLALTPLGSPSVPARQDGSGVWRGSSYSLVSNRRAHQLRLESNRFFDLARSDHEFQLGGSFIRETSGAVVAWPGSGAVSVQGENFGFAAGPDVAVVTREGRTDVEIRSAALWLRDTLEIGNLTASLGLRLDFQEGSNEAGQVAASPLRPDLLPALRFDGDAADDPSWLDLSPRFGVIWNPRGDIVLRASYARFAERLSVDRMLRTNPLSPGSAFHAFTDLDNDQTLDAGELGPLFFCDACGGDSSRAANRNARSLEASLTDEVTAEIEHAFRPEFTATLRFVYRRLSRIPEERVLIDDGGQIRVATRGDYQPDGFVTGTRPDGTPYRAPFFALRPGLRPTGGTLLVNGDREQEYRGVSLSLFKRLTGRWMLRGQATWSDWTWHVPETFQLFDDPTDVEAPGDNPGAAAAEPLPGPLGGSGSWLGGRWTFDVSGLYKVAPGRLWGFDLAGRIAGREGSPSPRFHRVVGSDGIVRDVAATGFDELREEDLVTVDLRLAKELRFDAWDVTLSFETFNLFDRTIVLARERNLALPTAGTPTETTLPRTLRWGLTFHLR